ncbi:MAG: hypothetical protein ACO317_05385, partial [Aquiluna sp.]
LGARFPPRREFTLRGIGLLSWQDWRWHPAYYDICQRYRREARARQVTGLNERPDIVLRRTRTFLTSDSAYQGVVVLQISGVLRAVSIRAELIYERYRITDIVLI